MDDHYHHHAPYNQQSAPPMQSGGGGGGGGGGAPYPDSRPLPPHLYPSSQPPSSQPHIQYPYSNHAPSQQSYNWSGPMALPWSSGASHIMSSVPQPLSMSTMNGLVNSGNGAMVGMPAAPSAPSRPKLTTTLWEDEATLCYQVDAKGICVARRQDDNMINGTKLLNVVGMSRGKRDGILKNEKGRRVVKVGAMHLKGVWITFQRAKSLASQFKILELLYPLFVEDPSVYLYSSTAVNSNASARLSNPPYGNATSVPYRSHPSFGGNHWDPRNPAHHNTNTSARHPTSVGPSQSEDEMYMLNPFDYQVPQGPPAMSTQNVGVMRSRNHFPTPVSISPSTSPSPSMDRPTEPQQPQSDYQSMQHAYNTASSDSESDSARRVMQLSPGRMPSPRHHPYGAPTYSSQPLQRL